MKTAIQPKSAISFIMPLLFCLVMSFNANAQDYTITTTGNAIVITDVSGNGETLSVSENNGKIRFVVSSDTLSLWKIIQN